MPCTSLIMRSIYAFTALHTSMALGNGEANERSNDTSSQRGAALASRWRSVHARKGRTWGYRNLGCQQSIYINARTLKKSAILLGNFAGEWCCNVA